VVRLGHEGLALLDGQGGVYVRYGQCGEDHCYGDRKRYDMKRMGRIHELIQRQGNVFSTYISLVITSVVATFLLARIVILDTLKSTSRIVVMSG